MPLHPFRALCLLAILLSLALPAAAQPLAPRAARDLAVIATVYPGILAAIEVDPAGRATVTESRYHGTVSIRSAGRSRRFSLLGKHHDHSQS